MPNAKTEAQIRETLARLRPGQDARIPLEKFYDAYGLADPGNEVFLTRTARELDRDYGLYHEIDRDPWPQEGQGWITFKKPPKSAADN